MTEYLYRIETPDHKAFAKYINEREFQFCEMRATTLGTNQVLVRQLSGNCVDCLYDVMDHFPESYFVV